MNYMTNDACTPIPFEVGMWVRHKVRGGGQIAKLVAEEVGCSGLWLVKPLSAPQRPNARWSGSNFEPWVPRVGEQVQKAIGGRTLAVFTVLDLGELDDGTLRAQIGPCTTVPVSDLIPYVPPARPPSFLPRTPEEVAKAIARAIEDAGGKVDSFESRPPKIEAVQLPDGSTVHFARFKAGDWVRRRDCSSVVGLITSEPEGGICGVRVLGDPTLDFFRAAALVPWTPEVGDWVLGTFAVPWRVQRVEGDKAFGVTADNFAREARFRDVEPSAHHLPPVSFVARYDMRANAKCPKCGKRGYMGLGMPTGNGPKIECLEVVCRDRKAEALIEPDSVVPCSASGAFLNPDTGAPEIHWLAEGRGEHAIHPTEEGAIARWRERVLNPKVWFTTFDLEPIPGRPGLYQEKKK